MIDDNIKLVYKYILTRKPIFLVELLMNNTEGMVFANKYFQNELRQECIDLILDTPFLKSHFDTQEHYVKSYINPPPKPKGCFRRV